MRKVLFLLLMAALLVSCGNKAKVDTSEVAEVEEIEKKEEMRDSAVKYYLSNMTNNYASAYTVATDKEVKHDYLNKAITDINIAMLEIEEEYVTGLSPASNLLELGESLKSSIEADMIGETQEAYNYAVEVGEIIGALSNEYLDGEMPTALQIMMDSIS